MCPVSAQATLQLALRAQRPTPLALNPPCPPRALPCQVFFRVMCGQAGSQELESSAESPRPGSQSLPSPLPPPARSEKSSRTLPLLPCRYGLDAGRFSLPSAVRSLPNGDLLVADGGACRLQWIEPAWRRRVGEAREGEGEGAVVEVGVEAGADPEGEDLSLDPHGSRVRCVHCSIGSGVQQLNFPTDLCVQGGAALVVERGNARVQRVGLEGEADAGLERVSPEGGVWSEAGLVHPWGVATHGGRVYVTDVGGDRGSGSEGRESLPGRVVILDAATLRVEGEVGRGQLRLPAGLDVLQRPDGGVELIIADHGLHRLCCIPVGGDLGVEGACRTIGRRGRAPGMFHAPVGVAVGGLGWDGRGGGGLGGVCLFVSEFSGRRVQALSVMGQPLAVFEPPGRSRLMGLSCGWTAGGVGVWVCDYDADCLHTLSVRVGADQGGPEG
jgi:hypothetical protein